MTSRSPSNRKGPRVWLALGIALAGTAAAGLWWQARSPESGGVSSGPIAGESGNRLNLLVVTLDTTRADRLGAYGYSGIKTPAMDRLAAEGTVFERAITAAPLTLPAHTTLMTGLYPPRHGVRDNGGFFVRDETLTLAERLRDRGYRTGAFVGAYVLASRWGLNQGFETYDDEFDLGKGASGSAAAVERPGNEVTDRALAWLAGAAATPFFAWVHFYDPHSPYRPPEAYARAYPGQPYLGEIAFTDSQVGRLMAFLEQRALLDRTVVVVVGDHGESLGEHGEATHGFFLYDATTRVPLIIRSPKLEPRRSGALVRTVDVLPTVLNLLELGGSDDIDGSTLLPVMTGAVSDVGLEAYSEAFYPRFHFGWSELLALHSGTTKYIAAPRPETYDLAADPAETRNLFEERREQTVRVMATLRGIEQDRPRAVPTPGPIDAETRGRLAALGYVASFAAAPPADAEGLADPKDKVDLFNLMTHAQELSRHRDQAGGNAEVAAVLRQVLARDRNVVDAWLMLGNELSRQRDYAAAVEQYRQALALKPDYDLAVIGLARAYRALGRIEDGIVGYRRFLAHDASNAQVRFELAQSLIDARKPAAAEAELQDLLTRDPSMALARAALGALRLERGEVNEAEREIQGALSTKPDIRLAHFHLALIAEGRGQLAAAEKEYRQEIQLFPDNHMAHFNLGKLLEQRGDVAGQLAAFRRAIDVSPDFAEGHLFLAKLLLDSEMDPLEAAALATRGIEIAPRGAFAPLGHYLLAEALSRQGRRTEAAAEIERGKALEARLRAGRQAAPPH
jgi:arylsulfatase A-like enzyme/Tfp pilus assembly protein PilF